MSRTLHDSKLSQDHLIRVIGDYHQDNWMHQMKIKSNFRINKMFVLLLFSFLYQSILFHILNYKFSKF